MRARRSSRASSRRAEGGAPSIGLLIGLVFVISGLAFKVSAAPFHMWTPDVYEGAPTPVTAFFATAPKVAAMALFARVVHDAFGGAVATGSRSWRVLSVLSMFLGAVAAIGQTDIKRLMAYSSIAHMGYALMGLAAGTVFRRRGDADLHGDLRDDEYRHLRLHPVDGADGQPVTEISALSCIRAAAGHEGAGAADPAVQPCRRAAAGGFLRQVYVLLAAV
jgi:NADH-quinone oxidoreductase subunit N